MISITKTLQGSEYDLYIITEFVYVSGAIVVTSEFAYQSQGHYNDGFVPIIHRRENTSHPATVASVANNYYTNYATALSVLESYLVANVAWYATGVVS